MTEILLYGEVGWDFDAKWLNAALDGSEGDVTLRVHSPGGDVFEGVAIANTIRRARRAGRRVDAVVDGLAASAASYMCLTCDRVLAGPGAVFMVHPPSGGCYGTASDMRRVAQALDTCDATIRDLYGRRCTRTDAEIADAMAAETWMTAADAVSFGLADGVDTDEGPDLSLVNARWAGASGDAKLAAFAGGHPALQAAMDSYRTHSDLFRERLERSRDFPMGSVDNAHPTIAETEGECDGDVGATTAEAGEAPAYAVANGHIYRIGERRSEANA